ncbi:MAG: hypothetical protein EBZ67_04280 [Chitinophagia bacterium]|nr:hypothetical protein [Chitinophagia bacterium]
MGLQLFRFPYAALLRFFKSKSNMANDVIPSHSHPGSAGTKNNDNHRLYVGGLWEEIGNLQFSFLLSQGLCKEHVLLDIACGSLRLGVKVIPFLEPGHYLGIDKERMLIEKGISEELDESIFSEKKPILICNSDFDFNQFGVYVDMAIAQSLFTHITSPQICSCLANLRPWMKPESRFFATFFESESEVKNPSEPDDHGMFVYTRRQMEDFGTSQGFSMNYLGHWNHPRNQMMVEYRLC